MTTLTTAQRKKLASSQFAMPKKRKYPIHNITHARNALARVSQYGSPYEKAVVRKAVYKKYPSLRPGKKTTKKNSVRRKSSQVRNTKTGRFTKNTRRSITKNNPTKSKTSTFKGMYYLTARLPGGGTYQYLGTRFGLSSGNRDIVYFRSLAAAKKAAEDLTEFYGNTIEYIKIMRAT